jgi:hypothetical protein
MRMPSWYWARDPWTTGATSGPKKKGSPKLQPFYNNGVIL